MPTSMEVVDAAKISYRQLDYWVRQGYIHLPPTGSGRQRSFTVEQREHVMDMADLVRAGLLPDLAHRIVAAEHEGLPMVIGNRQLLGPEAPLVLPLRTTPAGGKSALCVCESWVRVTLFGRLGKHGTCPLVGRRVRGADE